MTSPKKYRQVTRRSNNFLSLTFDFRPAMLRKNLARCSLLLRHVFTYIIPLHSSVTNGKHVQTNLIFFYLLIRTDGLVLFISLSHLKFSSNWKLPEIVWNQAWNKETWGAFTVPIKISLCSIHNTVVFRNNIEVITYPYDRRNTSVYFWSPFFFSRIYFPVTQICQSVDLVVNFSSLLLLSWLFVYSFTGRNRT